MAQPRLRTRTEMIMTIAAKDVRASWPQFIVAGVVAAIGGIATSSLAGSAGPYACTYRSAFSFAGSWSFLAYMYGFAAIATTIGVGLAFATFYGDELKRGTVRALILYPVDFNDITIAKLLAATVVGSLTSALAFMIPMAPLMASCLSPGPETVVIFLFALGTTVFIVWTGAFLSHILASFAKRMVFTPSAMAGILLVLAILLSQQSLNLVGLFFRNITSGGAYATPVDLAGIWNVAGVLAIVSPHHATATVLYGLFVSDGHFPDVFVVIPVGVLILAYGYLQGRRVPLDVFIK